MLTTFTGQSVKEIRNGDFVEDSKGSYYATADVVKDQWGDWMVKTDSNTWRTYPEDATVSLTFDVTEDE